jgi:hypothetical protein
MTNKIDSFNPPVSSEAKNSEEKEQTDLNSEERTNSSEDIQINFNSHNDLKEHLKTCDETEKKKLINSFRNSTRTDKKWEDVIQRGFLGYFCEEGKEEYAKEIIEKCFDPRSQKGRIQKYESFFGEYTGKLTEVIKPQITEAEKEILEKSFDIDSTLKFKEALDFGFLEIAADWILKTKKEYKSNIGRYKNMEKDEFKKFIQERESELRKEERENNPGYNN